ncbi:uncharacterized protein CIMG_08006 [Coccidioides immitis RS]|uniref:Uncharacterized protein n=1 Tax=Coccidioides immitis (strain RS) TaxID=246410 RepID=J3K4K9_COCIM|nr:uncharacterized protein CIMG_08006 [Coccidioides immitis RS]EAS29260.3 hypothetical protein CIMG_08006 [Coccidioides immitis RS]
MDGIQEAEAQETARFTTAKKGSTINGSGPGGIWNFEVPTSPIQSFANWGKKLHLWLLASFYPATAYVGHLNPFHNDVNPSKGT